MPDVLATLHSFARPAASRTHTRPCLQAASASGTAEPKLWGKKRQAVAAEGSTSSSGAVKVVPKSDAAKQLIGACCVCRSIWRNTRSSVAAALQCHTPCAQSPDLLHTTAASPCRTFHPCSCGAQGQPPVPGAGPTAVVQAAA